MPFAPRSCLLTCCLTLLPHTPPQAIESNSFLQAEINAEIRSVAAGKELPKGRTARVGGASGSPLRASKERTSKEHDATASRGACSDRKVRSGGSEGGAQSGGAPSSAQREATAAMTASEAAVAAETEARQAYADGRADTEAPAKPVRAARATASQAQKQPMSLHLTIDNHNPDGAIAAALSSDRPSPSSLAEAASPHAPKWQQQQLASPAVVRSPCAPGHRAAPVCNAGDSSAADAGDRAGASSSPQLSMLRGDGSTAARLSIQMLRLDSLNTGTSGSAPSDHPLVYGGSHRWLFSPQYVG